MIVRGTAKRNIVRISFRRIQADLQTTSDYCAVTNALSTLGQTPRLEEMKLNMIKRHYGCRSIVLNQNSSKTAAFVQRPLVENEGNIPLSNLRTFEVQLEVEVEAFAAVLLLFQKEQAIYSDEHQAQQQRLGRE